MTTNRHHAIALSATFVAVMLTLSGCDKTGSMPSPTVAAGAPATPGTPAYTPPTAAQLSQMVAPIALFPDKLVAQVLAGATYPDQISAANQWLGQNPALKGEVLQAAEDKEPWDVSVKSLTQFPAVLSQMASNPDWTRELGDAFVNDPNDVMNAIQALRQRAQQAGNLKSSGQLRVASVTRVAEPVQYASAPAAPVVYAGAPVVPPPPQTIVIESAQPDTVYVPHYDPAVVYGGPVPVYPGYAYRPPSTVGNEIVVGALSFGVGIFVGEAISHHGDWGWHDWGMQWGGPVERDRPASDWQRPAVVYKNTTYVSHSTTVINRVTNNVTVNNTRITNNVSNTSNINNNISNVRNTANVNNVNTFNNAQTRIENRPLPSLHAPQAATPMSMPHFTASDARPGAAPNPHAQAQAATAPHERAQLAQQEAAIQAQEHQRELAAQAQRAQATQAAQAAQAAHAAPTAQAAQAEKQAQQAEANRRKMMEEKTAPAAAIHAPEMKAANARPEPVRTEHKENVPPHPGHEQALPPARVPAQQPEAQKQQNHAAQAHAGEKHDEKHEERPTEKREVKPQARHEDKKEEGHHAPEKHTG